MRHKEQRHECQHLIIYYYRLFVLRAAYARPSCEGARGVLGGLVLVLLLFGPRLRLRNLYFPCKKMIRECSSVYTNLFHKINLFQLMPVCPLVGGIPPLHTVYFLTRPCLSESEGRCGGRSIQRSSNINSKNESEGDNPDQTPHTAGAGPSPIATLRRGHPPYHIIIRYSFFPRIHLEVYRN